MGTWGAGAFENDDASDWVYELEVADDDSVVRKALATVADADADEYVEIPEAASAIAAAEVVAAAAGAPAQSLPDEVRKWVGTHGASLPTDLRELARRAVERVRERSELREVWDGAGDPAWLAATGDLLARLGGS